MARRYTDSEIQQAARLLLLGRPVRQVRDETGMSLGKLSKINKRLAAEGAAAFGIDPAQPEADTGQGVAPTPRAPRRQRAQPGALRSRPGTAPGADDVPPPPQGVVLGPLAPRCDLPDDCCGSCPAALWEQWSARFIHCRAMIGTTDLNAVRDAGGVLVDAAGDARGVFLVEKWLKIGEADIEAGHFASPAALFVIAHRGAVAASSYQLNQAVDCAAAAGQGAALRGLVELRASLDPEQFGKAGRPVNVGATTRGDDLGADLLRQLRERRAVEDAEAAAS